MPPGRRRVEGEDAGASPRCALRDDPSGRTSDAQRVGWKSGPLCMNRCSFLTAKCPCCYKLAMEVATLAKKERRADVGARKRKKYNTGPKYDVGALRARIGKAHGIARVSRHTLAKLIGAAVGSIVNWERGMVPRPVYLEKLKEVERLLEAGELNLDLPRRGRRPRVPRPTSQPIAAVSVRGTRPLATEPSNAAPLYYANHVRIEQANGEACVRFVVVRPGTRESHAVADVILPAGALSGLRK
jgi:DNA-binding XRE family transcriptional regulator